MSTQTIALGQYQVPRGVYAEPFYDGASGKDRFAAECPPAIQEFLELKELKFKDDDVEKHSYDGLVQKMAELAWIDEPGWWDTHVLRQIVLDCQRQFMEKGVKVGICEWQANGGRDRWLWLEFADVSVVGDDYFSKFDLCNYRSIYEDLHYFVPRHGVAVEEVQDMNTAVFNGKKVLKNKCPEDLKALLERKALTPVYDEMIQALVESRKTLSFGGIYWRTKEMLPIVEQFQPQFERAGVTVHLCKFSCEDNMVFKWFEFIETDVVEGYFPRYDVGAKKGNPEKDAIISGHFVPEGVVIEPLTTSKLTQVPGVCPNDLKELLWSKELLPVYERLVQTIVNTEQVENFLDLWCFKKDDFIAVLKQFEDDMAKNGVRVVLCGREAQAGSQFWLEYIDVASAGSYSSLYAVANKNKFASGRYRVPDGVVIEPLLEGGQKELAEKRPPELGDLLSKKGLEPSYDRLIQTIVDKGVVRKGLISGCEWESEGIIAAIEELEKEFQAKGVKVCLCGRLWNSESFRWLEFIDTDVAESYVPKFDLSESRMVLGGKHRVPKGVEIEELQIGGSDTLVNKTPDGVQKLLDANGLNEEYKALVETLTKEESTRNWIGFWNSHEMLPILKDFETSFREKGVRVALCQRDSGEGSTLWWLEFIDNAVAAEYVPQFDVSNIDQDQEIKTSLTTLKFPNGVAVVQLDDGGGTMLKEGTLSPALKKMCAEKDLQEEYSAFISALCDHGLDDQGNWITAKIQGIAKYLGPDFSAKGVAVFICHKQEEVIAGGWKDFRWVEFVDLNRQPNYFPQRDVESKESRTGSVTVKTVVSIAITVSMHAAFIALEFA